MCMITYLAPGIDVPVDGIRNGASWNDDGHGWAVAADTGLILMGKSMDVEIALDAFMDCRSEFPGAPALFHSRWATHGVTDVTNVHPFYVGRSTDTVVAHNGVLPQVFHPGKGDTRSDTHVFADDWLGKQSYGNWTRRERAMIAGIIGSGNKLVILSASKKLSEPRGYVINRNAGWLDDKTGAWFSNSDYRMNHTYRPKYSGHWSSGVTVIGTPKKDDDKKESSTDDSKSATYHAFNDGKCPHCDAEGSVSSATNICRECEWCIDCWEHITECMCYVPDSKTTDEATAHEANVETVDILGSINESGSE